MLFKSIAVLALSATTFAAVRMPFTKSASISRRSLREQLDAPVFYELTINTTLGTPPQRFAPLIDTGSSLTWVHSATDPQCATAAGKCVTTFDSSKSTTFTSTGGTFDMVYSGGDIHVTGPEFTDVLDLAGQQITGATFGLSTDSNCPLQGILGLSYNPDLSIPSFIQKGVEQKVLERPVYSIWLNSASGTHGEIVFSGVNHAKYTGSLISVEMERQDDGTVRYLEVPATAFGILDAAGNFNSLFPNNYDGMTVFTDTGHPWGFSLPPAIYSNLLKALGAVQQSGGIFVPCVLASSSAKYRTQFGGADGPQIDVPISAFMYAHDSSTPPIISADGTTIDACSIRKVQVTDGDQRATFGMLWHEWAYVVHDLENKVVAIAQNTRDYSREDDIPEVEAGTAIPGAASTVAHQIPGFHGSSTTYQATTATPTTIGTATGYACSDPTVNLGIAACAQSSTMRIPSSSIKHAMPSPISIGPSAVTPWTSFVTSTISATQEAPAFPADSADLGDWFSLNLLPPI